MVVENFQVLKSLSLRKLSKTPQNNLEYRFRCADTKNIAFLWFLGKILEIFGLKCIFFKSYPKNCHISMGDSGKTAEVIGEMRTKVTSVGRNVHQNIFGLVSKGVEKFEIFIKEEFWF